MVENIYTYVIHIPRYQLQRTLSKKKSAFSNTNFLPIRREHDLHTVPRLRTYSCEKFLLHGIRFFFWTKYTLELVSSYYIHIRKLIFSDISERNNDYSDTLDFRRG